MKDKDSKREWEDNGLPRTGVTNVAHVCVCHHLTGFCLPLTPALQHNYGLTRWISLSNAILWVSTHPQTVTQESPNWFPRLIEVLGRPGPHLSNSLLRWKRRGNKETAEATSPLQKRVLLVSISCVPLAEGLSPTFSLWRYPRMDPMFSELMEIIQCPPELF